MPPVTVEMFTQAISKSGNKYWSMFEPGYPKGAGGLVSWGPPNIDSYLEGVKKYAEKQRMESGEASVSHQPQQQLQGESATRYNTYSNPSMLQQHQQYLDQQQSQQQQQQRAVVTQKRSAAEAAHPADPGSLTFSKIATMITSFQQTMAHYKEAIEGINQSLKRLECYAESNQNMLHTIARQPATHHNDEDDCPATQRIYEDDLLDADDDKAFQAVMAAGYAGPLPRTNSTLSQK